MTNARLIRRQELVVELDYGQFCLRTGDNDPTVMHVLLEQALDGHGIAQSGGLVVVVSPHQNNFEMPLVVEVWDAEPTDDLADWQEAFEAYLDVGVAGLTYDSPTVNSAEIDVPPGSYHALITGRGFVEEGWPGSTAPGDSWRIRLWPDSKAGLPTRLRAYAEPAYKTPPPKFRTAGVAAVHRIHDDLNRERPLSGERGRVVVERRIPGNRHQLFPSLRDPSGWLTQRGTSCDTQFVLQANGYDDEEFGDANRIVPRDGTIECQILEAKRPSYVVSTWTWRRNDADRVPAREIDERTAAILVPPQPQMTLRFDLETAPKLDGLPTSIVRVTHDFVPLEWVDDLSAYWRWMFERADYQFDLGNIRRKTPVPRIEIPPGD